MEKRIVRIAVSVAAAVALTACGTSQNRAEMAEAELDALQQAYGEGTLTPDAIVALRDMIATLMSRADITPQDVQALQEQVATLMGRADITPQDVQALQEQVATLMGRADITPQDLQALQEQVDTLMGRADITAEEVQALEQALEQALNPSWTPVSGGGVHLDFSATTSRPADAGVTMIESARLGTFYVTYMVDGVEQRIHLTPADYNRQYVTGTNPRIWLWDTSNSFTIAPDFRYLNINGWAVSDYEIAPDGSEIPLNERRGFIVYGTQTEGLPAGTADYEGRMYANGWSRTDPSRGTGRHRIYGEVALTADFDNRSIDGMVSAMEVQRAGQSWVAWDADILIRYGTIDDDSGIRAQLEGQREAAGIKGTVTGQFFGPEAAEVGGVISAEDTNTVYGGFFGGRKQ